MGNYNDEQGTIDSQIYWKHLFGNNPGGSFSDYYFEVSHETFYPTGNVHGWYDVDISKSESVEDPRSFVVSVLELSDDDIGYTAIGHGIASALHETQYTRLFRS